MRFEGSKAFRQIVGFSSRRSGACRRCSYKQQKMSWHLADVREKKRNTRTKQKKTQSGFDCNLQPSAPVKSKLWSSATLPINASTSSCTNTHQTRGECTLSTINNKASCARHIFTCGVDSVVVWFIVCSTYCDCTSKSSNCFSNLFPPEKQKKVKTQTQNSK